MTFVDARGWIREMAGAEFLRADLHVHTFPDVQEERAAPPEEYVAAAQSAGISVLGVTDHNTAKNVETFLTHGESSGILILPGVEVTTHQGHLLALFAPTAVAHLQEFATIGNLQLNEDPRDVSLQRSARSMLDLVNEIDRRGGLAIPAHVDAADGAFAHLATSELIELLSHPGLAGIEFAKSDALRTWFADDDADDGRREAWQVRRRNQELRARGLARIMSSDAHSPEKVGVDRASRTLTRLRLDEPDFAAVRNALIFNPKGRCKAEALLPINYPRILSAAFEGGFLDGVTLDFSSNLTSIIGGRGSGKSTALIALRTALGARLAPGDDPDEPDRMPDRTLVKFVDKLGSQREVVRERGGPPIEVSSGAEVSLVLADLGQGESGRLARTYDEDPRELLSFLDRFVDLTEETRKEEELLALLADNEPEVQRTATRSDQLRKLEVEQTGLEASLRAAQQSRIDQIAEWAVLLAAQPPFLDALQREIEALAADKSVRSRLGLEAIATDYGVDLTHQLAREFVDGEAGLRHRLEQFAAAAEQADTSARSATSEAAKPAFEVIDRWREKHAEMQQRLDRRRRELEEQGLKVEAGEALRIASRLQTVRSELARLRELAQAHQAARRSRRGLLDQLHANRERIYEKRRAVLKQVVDAANRASDGYVIHLHFGRGGLRDDWIRWLSQNFRFRSPRVERLSSGLNPRELSELLLAGEQVLLAYRLDGEAFFDQTLLAEVLSSLRKWEQTFRLEKMVFDDLPRIEIQEPGSPVRRQFTQLSAGQQRSVLLSLILCAEQTQPLVLDQPEDHLDAEYIAHAVVRHLDAAKERRQVIIATHSANLTVLGDAELVIPMYADGRHGSPRDVGAVDRPATRERVCSLLEGGAEAYRRRGQRYGFRVEIAI